MPEHTSWLNFLPGYGALEHALHSQKSWMEQNPVHVQHIAAILLVILVMTVLAVMARGGLNKAKGDILPDKKLTARNLVELMMEAVLGIMAFAMPRQAALRHFWLIGTLGFFLLFSNLLGLIPGFLPPTESFNTTFACGTIVFIYYNFYAFAKMGMGHIAHMANPMGEPIGWVLSPLFIVIEVISHCIRPVSLSVRLLCNIAGDHLVLGVFVGIFPLILPLPFMALGLFVALVQVFIFLLLSSVYIGEVEANIEHAQHAHGHGHDGHEAHGAAAAGAH